MGAVRDENGARLRLGGKGGREENGSGASNGPGGRGGRGGGALLSHGAVGPGRRRGDGVRVRSPAGRVPSSAAREGFPAGWESHAGRRFLWSEAGFL